MFKLKNGQIRSSIKMKVISSHYKNIHQLVKWIFELFVHRHELHLRKGSHRCQIISRKAPQPWQRCRDVDWTDNVTKQARGGHETGMLWGVGAIWTWTSSFFIALSNIQLSFFHGSIRKRLTHWTRSHDIAPVLAWSWESSRKTVRSENFSRKTKVRGALFVSVPTHGGLLMFLTPVDVIRTVITDDWMVTQRLFVHVLMVCLLPFFCHCPLHKLLLGLFSLQSYGHRWKNISRH